MDEWDKVPSKIPTVLESSTSPMQLPHFPVPPCPEPPIVKAFPVKPTTSRLSHNAIFAQYRDPSSSTDTSSKTSLTSPTSTMQAQPARTLPSARSNMPLLPEPAGSSGVGASGGAEWATIEISETFIPRTRNQPPASVEPPMTYDVAWNFFYVKSDWKTKEIKRQPSRGNNGVLSRLLTPKLDHSLDDERQFIFYFQKVPLDHNIPEHNHIIATIYRFLTGDSGNVSASGDHLQKIGFQGTDPATDLRSSGMFSLLQCLYLMSQDANRSHSFYLTATSSTHEFPYVLCSINFTTMALDMFRDKRLHRLANRHHSIIAVINQVYIGLFSHFVTIWRSKSQRSIAEWDTVRRELKAVAVDNVFKIFTEGSIRH